MSRTLSVFLALLALVAVAVGQATTTTVAATTTTVAATTTSAAATSTTVAGTTTAAGSTTARPATTAAPTTSAGPNPNTQAPPTSPVTLPPPVPQTGPLPPSSSCKAAPTPLAICNVNHPVPGFTTSQQEGYSETAGFQTTSKDASLVGLFDRLSSTQQLPSAACAIAFSNYYCSNMYPMCNAWGNEWLVCKSVCEAFVQSCEGMLPFQARPNCNMLNNGDCTANTGSAGFSAWYSETDITHGQNQLTSKGIKY